MFFFSCRYQSSPDSSVQSDLTDILGSVTELAHVMVAKVISVRSEPHTSLPLHEFWEFFNETWSFVIGCEVICRRMVVGLRGAVVGQVSVISHAYLVQLNSLPHSRGKHSFKRFIRLG